MSRTTPACGYLTFVWPSRTGSRQPKPSARRSMLRPALLLSEPHGAGPDGHPRARPPARRRRVLFLMQREPEAQVVDRPLHREYPDFPPREKSLDYAESQIELHIMTHVCSLSLLRLHKIDVISAVISD